MSLENFWTSKIINRRNNNLENWNTTHEKYTAKILYKRINWYFRSVTPLCLTSFAKKRTLTQTLYRGILDKFKFWKWFSLSLKAPHKQIYFPSQKNLLKQSHMRERKMYVVESFFLLSGLNTLISFSWSESTSA